MEFFIFSFEYKWFILKLECSCSCTILQICQHFINCILQTGNFMICELCLSRVVYEMVASQNDLKFLCQNLTSIKDICGAVGLGLAASVWSLLEAAFCYCCRSWGAESPSQMPASGGEGEVWTDLGQWAAVSQGLADPKEQPGNGLLTGQSPSLCRSFFFQTGPLRLLQSQRAFQNSLLFKRQQDAILLLEFKNSE